MFYILTKENHCQEGSVPFIKQDVTSDLGTDNVTDEDS